MTKLSKADREEGRRLYDLWKLDGDVPSWADFQDWKADHFGALLADSEALEGALAERDATLTELALTDGIMRGFKKEADALRAKVERLEAEVRNRQSVISTLKKSLDAPESCRVLDCRYRS